MRGRRASCSWLRSGCQRDELRWCPPRERTRVPSGVVVAPLATDLDGTGADHPLGRIEGGAERHVLADETVPLGERMLEHLVGAPAFEHLPIQLRLSPFEAQSGRCFLDLPEDLQSPCVPPARSFPLRGGVDSMIFVRGTEARGVIAPTRTHVAALRPLALSCQRKKLARQEEPADPSSGARAYAVRVRPALHRA